MAFKSTNSDVTTGVTNIISKGTKIEGDLYTESNLSISGSFKGGLVCKNTLTIGETGEVDGEIEATNANIFGKVKGKLIVKQKLVLESTSSMVGELKAAKLIVEEGAVFQGTSDMGVDESKPVPPKPALSPKDDDKK